MNKYDWAVNQNKLQRAIGKAGNGNEGAIKELYIEMGGLLSPNYEPKVGDLEAKIIAKTPIEPETPIEETEVIAEKLADEVLETEEEEVIEEETIVVKKRGRPSKNA